MRERKRAPVHPGRILNNQYLGMVRQWQELFNDKRYAGTCLQCENGEYWPDFVKLADAYGFKGLRVTDPSKVRMALHDCRSSKETFIVEVMIEPESNILPMLPPGGALNTFFSRKQEKKSIYDWYRRLPRTEGEISDYKVEITNEDAFSVYYEEEVVN